MAHTGGCLCGAIRYTITAPITELRACHCVHCQRASGSHGTLASRTIRPAESTTQMLALSSDTSIPAYCSMVVPSMMLEQAKA